MGDGCVTDMGRTQADENPPGPPARPLAVVQLGESLHRNRAGGRRNVSGKSSSCFGVESRHILVMFTFCEPDIRLSPSPPSRNRRGRRRLLERRLKSPTYPVLTRNVLLSRARHQTYAIAVASERSKEATGKEARITTG